MTWLASIFVGGATGVLTAIATALAASVGTEWHDVSNMEGGRGMLIVFVFIPLGFVVGLVIGLVIAKRAPVDASGFGRFGMAAGLSLGLVALGTGAAWATADHAPRIDGKFLELEYEVRLPPGFPVRDSFQANDLRIAVVASSTDRSYSTIDFEGIRQDGEFIVVPGSTPLNSSNFRDFAVTWGPFAPYPTTTQRAPIPLSPRPKRGDLEWSPWYPLTRRRQGEEVPEAEQARVRYRVHQIEEAAQ